MDGLLARFRSVLALAPSDGYIPLAAASPALLAELEALDQPLLLCFPGTYRVHCWLDVHDRKFATKGLSIMSSTFEVGKASDDLVVFRGLTNKGKRWKAEIRRMSNVRVRKKYLADLQVGKEEFPDRLIYGADIEPPATGQSQTPAIDWPHCTDPQPPAGHGPVPPVD